jgi:hypothetical protein
MLKIKEIMTYKSFDEILNDETVNNTDRINFTRQWLKTNYGYNNPNEEWVNIISDVHDHDNQPKHFGEVSIGSSFSVFKTQLVRVQEGWHLGVTRNNQTQGTILHPKTEPAGKEPENQKLTLALGQTLKTGKLIENVQQIVTTPVVSSTNNEVTINLDQNILYYEEDQEIAAQDDIQTHRIEDPFLSSGKTKSVSIDLSSYLQ